MKNLNFRRPWFDKMIYGIVLGICIPFACYGILLMVYDQLDKMNIFNNSNLSSNYRERTIAIIAIIGNAICMQILNRKNALQAMRGLVFPTLAYVILWMWLYGKDLLG